MRSGGGGEEGGRQHFFPKDDNTNPEFGTRTTGQAAISKRHKLKTRNNPKKYESHLIISLLLNADLGK